MFSSLALNSYKIPRLSKADGTKLLLSAIFISSVFIPLIRMLTYMDSDSISSVLESPNFGTAIKNSLVSSILSTVITVILAFTLALCTATASVIIAFLTAYLSARIKSKTSRFLHLSAMTSAAIPGVVLGLSYVLTFNTTPIYGTLIILIMVNIVHFMESPYLMMYNSLSKINENLESVASTMGISRMHMIKDVFIVQCIFTLLEMFSYFFVNCMMTISAVSFLATTMNKPVSLMINQYEAQMQLEEAAVVSLMILLINLIIKLVVYIIKGIGSKRVISK